MVSARATSCNRVSVLVAYLEKKSLEPVLDWLELTEWLKDGHARPRPQIHDHILVQGANRLLNRIAWIEGLGSAIKTCTIYPDNAGRGIGTVNGMMTLFANLTGEPEIIVDFHLVTKWKTAADSLLAASLLAPSNPKRYLIVGAGAVARSLVEAYTSLYPDLAVTVWNRTEARALELVRDYSGRCDISHASNLVKGVESVDIVSCATMSTEPVIRGDWITPGTHVDLIGAYTPETREADDKTLQAGTLFVDYRETTVGHIGEFVIPMAKGVIDESVVVADYYDLQTGRFARNSEDEITVFKNGGGAHLDLMTGRYIHAKWQQIHGSC